MLSRQQDHVPDTEPSLVPYFVVSSPISAMYCFWASAGSSLASACCFHALYFALPCIHVKGDKRENRGAQGLKYLQVKHAWRCSVLKGWVLLALFEETIHLIVVSLRTMLIEQGIVRTLRRSSFVTPPASLDESSMAFSNSAVDDTVGLVGSTIFARMRRVEMSA